MNIYYAHPMIMYGSSTESEDLKSIKKQFPEAVIINPSNIKPESIDNSMSIYLKIVKKSDLVIVRKIPYYSFTAGIGKEVNYALKHAVPVFEIKNQNYIPIKKPVEYLGRIETVKLFEKIRINKKYSKLRSF